MPAESALVGREAEIAVVEECLETAETSLAALAIVGDPGIGKTMLWQEAVRRARERGSIVLLTRPGESEARLAFAGLTDLLAEVGPEALGRLPAPQREALEVALLRAEARHTPGRRLVGTGLLSLLSALSSNHPVTLAVDDAQWLDAPSSAAIEFALRRLGDHRVCVVVSMRSQAVRPGFVAALDDRQLRRLELGPLSVAALQRIIADRLDVTFPRPNLVRIAAASKGNAFYALEIARLLAGDAGAATTEPLPVPDDLRTLVERRIARLPRTTRAALLRAAALARATSSLVDVAALAPAEDAGLVAVTRDGHVEFTHPLFAAAVYRSASARDRADAHRELASVVPDAEERARHLALASTGPDAATAAALDEAARQARARGAPDAAAELAELAVRLTPERDEARNGRSLALGEHLLLAGDFGRAAEVLQELVSSADSGDLRARARLTLAEIVYWRSGESAAVRVAEEALRDAVDPLLRARCLAALAMLAGTSDLPRAADAARASLELLGPQPGVDPALLSLALSTRVRADLFLGEGFDRAAAERALELESAAPPVAVDTRVAFKLGQWLRYVDDFDGSRRYLAASERAAEEEGDESSLANILLNRTLLECWSGAWGTAAELAERTQTLFAQTGIPLESSSVWRAYVDAHYGRVEAVRAAASQVPALAEPAVRMLWQRSLGLAELAAGEAASASRHMASAVAALAEMGFREPAVWRIDADAIETALAVGDVERAETTLAALTESAARSRIPWSLAVCARCRGLLLDAQGRTEEAAGVLAEALEEHERSPVPFELARTLLVHGRVLRRLKQKRAARDSLERAAAMFDELGAAPWAERARDELRRTAARAAPVDLSETELRIARLAAAGLTNDGIASEVFVTRKTVEANLSRAYRKLGIRSRAQLARALDAREETAIP